MTFGFIFNLQSNLKVSTYGVTYSVLKRNKGAENGVINQIYGVNCRVRVKKNIVVVSIVQFFN
jgi:hypothetical protein